MQPLPIDEALPRVRIALAGHRACIVTAAPGAGKTTRVPPALVDDGPVLLLQPRRVAARSIARRIADERGWTIGREIGWHVRLERRFTRETRLLVATEGMLTARLQQDPLLSEFRTVVIDEFHERTVHADLGLALARQAWLARDDLRLVVMSATLDASRVAAFLGHCPVIHVEGRAFPVEVSYQPGLELDDAILREWTGCPGAILAFLPGAAEIRRVAERLVSRLPPGSDVLPLHGGLLAAEQDAALRPATRPRVILATNLAETTVTVPDVRVVIDSGLHKVARYDAARGIDRLETERVPLDSADQRAGRAGRVAAGRAVRLWEARDRLRHHREPEIVRVDLAGVVLEILGWGGNPTAFEWFEVPPAEALHRAVDLLRQLGAVDATMRLTAEGARLRRLPLHPRLARLLLSAAGSREAAVACALLTERHARASSGEATTCDVLAAVDRSRDLPAHVMEIARDLSASVRADASLLPATGPMEESAFRQAVLAAYPDRIARCRSAGSDRFLLASGTGARLGRESGVRGAEFIVAVDVTAGQAGPANPAGEAIIRMATRIEDAWLEALGSVEVLHEVDSAGAVRAWRRVRIGAIELRREPTATSPDVRAALILEVLQARGPDGRERQILLRLRAAGVDVSHAALVERAVAGAASASEVDIVSALHPDEHAALVRHAPEAWVLPSGRRARLTYEPDGRVMSAVKLQELFGLADSPRIGPNRVPVSLELLAPNGRPVQVTSDLRSFWNGAYQEVRKALRARYPRHPWPEDPWTALPTHRTTPRVTRGAREGPR